jgi:LPS-assembly lipoprotein
VLCLFLAACGFHLRGQGDYRSPYQTVYVEGDSRSALVSELKRAVSASGSALAESPAAAQAVLQVVGEFRDKSILSLSGAGRVREYQLQYRVSYLLRDAAGRELIAPGDILLKRAISFTEAEILAKESEEALLYRDMESDAVQQIMRRLSVVK